MPLSPPAEREPIHRRAIVIDGYRRDDGLFDIEATLADTKSYEFDLGDRGTLIPGDRIHGMAMRITVDSDFLITGVDAAMDHTPYLICPGAVPKFDRLVGLRIGKGFLKAVAERVGGTEGCVHLRELLAQMATVAFQTIGPLRARTQNKSNAALLLNTCHAFAADGELVRRRFPELAQG
jgi:Protein of unknown function (DUF2889)